MIQPNSNEFSKKNKSSITQANEFDHVMYVDNAV